MEVFFLQSYDATTHFETTVTDVLSMYTAITGKVSFIITYFYFRNAFFVVSKVDVSDINFINAAQGLRIQHLL